MNHTTEMIFLGVMMLAFLGMMSAIPFILRGIIRFFKELTMGMKALVLVAGLSAAVSGVWIFMPQEHPSLMSVEEAAAKVQTLSRDNYGCGRWKVVRHSSGAFGIFRPEGRPFYDFSGCPAVESVRLYNLERISDLNAEIDRATSLSEMHKAIGEMRYAILKPAIDMAKKEMWKGIGNGFPR